MWPHILLLLSLNAFLGVRAFNTTTSTPTQCGSFTVNWTGGKPPFTLEVLPVQGTQRVYNISADAFNNGVGSYSIVLQLAQEQQFLVTMSDATGFATGGISPLLSVLAQTSDSSDCNTVDPSPQFFYSLDFALQQCLPYTFSDYSDAIPPVTIYGLVPGGTAVVLHASKNATESSWDPADIAAGTSILFVMTDAQHRTGGVSDIKVAGSTNNTSCLNARSPSVTLKPIQTSLSASSSSSASSVPSSNSSPKASSSGNISGGALIAAIGGLLVFLGVLLALGAFLFRRRRKAKLEVDGGYPDSLSHITSRRSVDHFPILPATDAPYEMSRMGSSVASLIPHPAPVVTIDSVSPVHPPSARSISRKSNTTTSTRHQPAQVILHAESAPDELGFMEPPPQYSEDPRPLPAYGFSENGVPPSIQSSHTP